MRLLFVLLAVLAAAAAGGRPDLNGSWTLEPTRSQAADITSATLTISQSDSEVQVKEAYSFASGKTGTLEFRCNTMGKECAFKSENEPVKVSLWYGGPRLVVMETRGKHGDVVRKRQFGLATDGALTVEISSISPPGDKQTLVYRKK